MLRKKQPSSIQTESTSLSADLHNENSIFSFSFISPGRNDNQFIIIYTSIFLPLDAQGTIL